MPVPLIKTGSALGILMLFTMGYWIDYETVHPSTNIWKDSLEFGTRNGELVFNTSAHFGWWTGFKWDTTFQAKLPCEHKEETVEFTQADEDKTFRILDRIHYDLFQVARRYVLSQKVDFVIGMPGNIKNSRHKSLSSSEIGFLTTQFKTGVYLSLKVLGAKGVRIGQRLKRLDGRIDQDCTYKFSSKLHIDQDVLPPFDKEHFYSTLEFEDYDYNPMIIRVPRDHTVRLHYPWYTLIPFVRALFKTPSIGDLYACFHYAELVEDNANISLPSAVVSSLFCY